MRTRIIASTFLVICFSQLSCHSRGIIELSRGDTGRCDQMVARDGELLIALMSAMNDFLAKAPESEPKLQEVRAQCTDHLEGWDRLVRELYEKYGLSEETYRLDVFRGSFAPKLAGDRSTAGDKVALRLSAGMCKAVIVLR